MGRLGLLWGNTVTTWLVSIACLLDPRAPTDERVAAATALGASGVPEVATALRSAAVDPHPAVADAAIAALGALNTADAAALLGPLAADSRLDRADRARVVATLAAMTPEDAGEQLWQVAGDRAVPARVRNSARRALDAHFPAVAERLGPPRVVSDPIGSVALIGASGAAGAILLSSVGRWGQFEGGEVLGGVGGAAIGLGGGAVAALTTPVTAGQGLAFASGVGWGAAGGSLAASTVAGASRWIPDSADRRDGDAAWRAAGTLVGGGVGLLALRAEPDAWDVAEVDLTGYLGSAISLAAVDLATWSDLSLAGQDLLALRRDLSQIRTGATLGGAAIGLGAGFLLAPHWELDWRDGLFAAVLSAEGEWIGDWTPEAIGVDDSALKGTIRLPWHLAAAGGLAWAELDPPSVNRTALLATGLVAGNASGAGLALLGGDGNEQRLAQVMLPLGVVGAAAGVLASDHVALDPGDWATLAVASAATGAETALFASYALERGAIDETRVGGWMLLTPSVSAMTVVGVSDALSVAPAEALTVGAGGLWGGYFGVLLPIAFDASDATTQLTTATTGLVGMGAGGALLLGGVAPRDTLIPQLGGVTGATIGALVAAFASPEVSDVALGGAVGGAVGLAGGALIGQVLEPPTLRLPALRGALAPQLTPTDGGVLAGLSWVGW